MKIMVKFVKAWMRNDHHAALPEQRLVAIHIEVIPERHHLHQQWVQSRINVVRRNVRNTGYHDVALAFDRYLVLSVVEFENPLVDRFGASRITADQLILRRDRVQQLSTRGPGQV